jgi:hypothetical protein
VCNSKWTELSLLRQVPSFTAIQPDDYTTHSPFSFAGESGRGWRGPLRNDLLENSKPSGAGSATSE